MNVASRIKGIRNGLGLTMKEFGQKFDPPASDSIVSRWERGISAPNNRRLKRIRELEGEMNMETQVNKDDKLILVSEKRLRELLGVEEENQKLRDEIEDRKKYESFLKSVARGGETLGEKETFEWFKG